MESMTLAISLLASLVVWFALHALARDHRACLVRVAHRMHGIRPLARRNSYLCTRRNAFVSVKDVREAEQLVLRAVHWLVIPAVSALPVIVSGFTRA